MVREKMLWKILSKLKFLSSYFGEFLAVGLEKQTSRWEKLTQATYRLVHQLMNLKNDCKSLRSFALLNEWVVMLQENLSTRTKFAETFFSFEILTETFQNLFALT